MWERTCYSIFRRITEVIQKYQSKSSMRHHIELVGGLNKSSSLQPQKRHSAVKAMKIIISWAIWNQQGQKPAPFPLLSIIFFLTREGIVASPKSGSDKMAAANHNGENKNNLILSRDLEIFQDNILDKNTPLICPIKA